MKRTAYIFCLFLLTIFSVAEGYSVFEINGKVGLKNEAGKVLIPAKYEALGWSDGAFSILNNVTGYRSAGKWGLISLTNHVITKAEFDEISPTDGSLLIARKRSSTLRVLSGLLNASGKEIIPFQYDDIRLTSLRAIVFTKIGDQYKYGLLDLDNKILIPQQYRNIIPIGSLRYAAENFDGKWAVFTDSGKQITTFDFDRVSPFERNYAIVHRGTHQGLIDREGVIKVQPTFREMKVDDRGIVLAKPSSSLLFLDGQHKLQRKIDGDSIDGICKNLLRINSAGFIQLTDGSLRPLTTAVINTLEPFSKDKAIFSASEKYGLITKNGTVLVEPKYTTLKRSDSYLISTIGNGTKNNLVVLDSLGKPLHTKTYDLILPFNGKFFPVMNGKSWGALSPSGKEILSCTYDSILQADRDNIVVKFHGQYGVVNHNEHWLVAPKPNKIRLIAEDRFLEYSPRTTYLKSFDNSIIYFSENKLEVQDNSLLEYLPSGTIWLISLNGVIADRSVMPEGIEKIYPETEGLRGIKKNGQYGFIDSQGRLRIANRYDDIQPFSEQMAAMKIRGKWGFIGHDDRIAIQPIYDEVSNFKNALATVKHKGFFGVVDKTGKQVVLPRYESVSILSNRNIVVKQNGLKGLIDPQGRILINPKFNKLDDLDNGFIIVERDGKYGAVTSQGISTIPLVYDYLCYDRANDIFYATVNAAWTEIKL
jgi:hypothetical protein